MTAELFAIFFVFDILCMSQIQLNIYTNIQIPTDVKQIEIMIDNKNDKIPEHNTLIQKILSHQLTLSHKYEQTTFTITCPTKQPTKTLPPHQPPNKPTLELLPIQIETHTYVSLTYNTHNPSANKYSRFKQKLKC